MTTKHIPRPCQIPAYKNHNSDSHTPHISSDTFNLSIEKASRAPVDATFIQQLGATTAAFALGLTFSLLGPSAEPHDQPIPAVQQIERS